MKSAELKTQLRCIKIEPKKDPVVVLIDPTLEAMQEQVEGYIEVYPCPWDNNLVLIFNEEGKIMGQPMNRYLYGTGKAPISLVGPIVICGTDGDSFCSITRQQMKDADDMIQKYLKEAC